MCGIVGYIGKKEAQPVLVNSLKRLEYRGYDSCGLALLGAGMEVFKDAVRIAVLEKTLRSNGSHFGIGHTRWATHGKPSQINAHPHLDCSGKVAVVHNGVIDNFHQLKEQLIREGHTFRSETDTEVIPHLIERYYQGDLGQAVSCAAADITGSYAFIAAHIECQQLAVARNESPLIIGVGDRENIVASDVPAVLDYTDRVIYLEDGDIGLISQDEIRLTNNGGPVKRTQHHIPWTIEEAQKAGHEHFMIKEIHEQPKAIRNTCKGYLSAIEPVVTLGIEWDTDFNDILILACGTSYHAALIGKHMIQRLARIPVRVEIASEFNYSDAVLSKTWVIAITQSGETADSLRALKRAREFGCNTLAITNVVGSSATRIASESLYINAGPEICVAATKSFITQLVAMYLVALVLASVDVRTRSGIIAGLRQLPEKVQEVLEREREIAEYGKYIAAYENVFFIARGLNFPVALEGALKLKEIAYIRAEGYPAGELKHGPLALFTPDTLVISAVARDNTYEPLLTNIKEIEARGASVIAISEDDDDISEYVDHVVRVPKVDPIFSPVVNSIAMQLLAYYAAKERGCPIDTPRNLAKSVTVE